jgi:hypothetical protein
MIGIDGGPRGDARLAAKRFPHVSRYRSTAEVRVSTTDTITAICISIARSGVCESRGAREQARQRLVIRVRDRQGEEAVVRVGNFDN